jgi:uncharacterized protein YyaL (SSP411 family)
MKNKIYNLLLLFAIVIACNNKESINMSNNLINETSPYLLQHAYNPVNWNPWNKTYIDQAKSENKLIVISVGYSSCHWCHVMERESFEDTLVAKIMNEKYISIKVDREERPDVDNVYMSAVQLMTGSGGWPLNVVTLPDGRPIWGGTYFTKDQWIGALNQISELYEKDPDRLITYADQLEEGIKSLDLIELNNSQAKFSMNSLENLVNIWSDKFDIDYGGNVGAPKFMMPSNLHFLLKYAYQTENEKILEHVNNSLIKIAYGGVYDHIGGGFSRYAVDEKWHIPHFEKMLYDNAQLISLYSDAYKLTKNKLYKDVVYQTIDFANKNFKDSKGGYYSSLDADSKNDTKELEEGVFYTWNKSDLKKLLKNDFTLFSDYYNINEYGLWENENYVLIRKMSDEEVSKKYNITIQRVNKIITNCNLILFNHREKRSKPRLDDKVLASWNGLMIKGLADSYKAFNDKRFLKNAVDNGNFIIDNLLKNSGQILHSYKAGESKINGYLEDYASVISGFISLHEITLDKKWLDYSKKMTEYVYDNFYNNSNQMFYFTSIKDDKLINRTVDFRDNVIPSSNSIMANNLFLLSHYYDNENYFNTASTMLNNVLTEIGSYPSSFSNWLDLMLKMSDSFYEVAITGKKAISLTEEINTIFQPNKLIIGSEKESNLPLLKNRFIKDETYIYVCVKKACKLPVKTSEKAIELIRL